MENKLNEMRKLINDSIDTLKDGRYKNGTYASWSGSSVEFALKTVAKLAEELYIETRVKAAMKEKCEACQQREEPKVEKNNAEKIKDLTDDLETTFNEILALGGYISGFDGENEVVLDNLVRGDENHDATLYEGDFIISIGDNNWND